MEKNLLIDAIGFKKKKLTAEIFLRSGINTIGELKLVLKNLLDIEIPDSRMCNNKTHSTPFKLFSDMFFGKVNDAIGLANRSGGKSCDAGLLTFLKSIWPGSSTRILGGSVDQSDKSYQAFAGCWEKSELGPKLLKTDVQIKKTKLKNKAEVEILTASLKSVRGPHQPNLILDEIEEMEEKIMNAALSQPQSEGGMKSSTLRLSTRHKAGGLMSQVIETHEEKHLALYIWCIWEVIESCKDYSCSRCPLSSICPGKQIKNATGYYTIEDLIKKMYQLDEESLESEWFCEKPSRKGLVYSKFDEDTHIIDCDFNSSLPIALSIDWGGIDPFVVLVWQKIKGRGDVIVDEIYQGNTTNQAIIQICKSKPWWKYAQGQPAYCDPARQDLIAEWRAIGINATGRKSTLDDINLVRAKLAPVLGDPTLFVNRKCKMVIWEANHYRLDKDEHPIDKNNHAMDCVRYYVRGTRISTAGDRPRIILGQRRDLLGKPLGMWPLWKEE